MTTTYHPLSTLPREAKKWFLLFDEDDKVFYPAFWDQKANPRYPIHFIDDCSDIRTDEEIPHYQWICINGIDDKPETSGYSWMPWPIPEQFSSETP